MAKHGHINHDGRPKPRDPIPSPARASSLRITFSGRLVSDSLIVTSPRAVASVAVVFLAVMVILYLGEVLGDEGTQEILISWGRLSVSRKELNLTMFQNTILLFAEGVVSLVRHRKSERLCVFVRQPQCRDKVLFTEIFVPNPEVVVSPL